VLGELFPLSPETSPRGWRARGLAVVAQVALVVIASVAMLLRVPGLPSWDTIYAEDYWEFLTQAIQHPWHLAGYAGYVQILPRVVAQVVTYLPLADASLAFALMGALIAACSALFIFHASAGHIRSAKLRVLLALGLVLLPAAPMEVIDSGVNALWYLLPVLFWAMLWRPRTRSAIALAAVIGFVAAASNILAMLLAPLLAVRLYVLRRPREHGVTVGWLAGFLLEVPFVIAGALRGGDARLNPHATPGQSLAFYGHDVLLPSLGWHMSWWLRSFGGINGATAIAAVVLVVSFAMILVSQPGTRPFVVTALMAGFTSAIVSITLNGKLATAPLLPTEQPGNRYTIMPVFLIVSAVIVGVDYALRPRARGHRRSEAGLKSATAVTMLVVFLAVTWAVDFRYTGWRSRTSWNWAPIAAKWERDCAHSATGEIVERVPVDYQTLPCRNLTP
jgi:hypothetical protein